MSDESVSVNGVRSVRLYLYHAGEQSSTAPVRERSEISDRALPLNVHRPRQGWDTVYIKCPMCRQRVGIHVGSVGQLLVRTTGKLTVLGLGLLGGFYLMRSVGDTDLGQCLLAAGELMWIWTITTLFPERAIALADAHTQHTIERA
jgi:hypothetical protein